MADATTYYYNKNKAQVCLHADDHNHYYLPPKSFSFIKDEIMGAPYVIPPGVVAYPLPEWWTVAMWPMVKPWESEPTVPVQPEGDIAPPPDNIVRPPVIQPPQG